MMKKFYRSLLASFLASLLKDEEGQAVTEYVLMLSCMVGIALLALKKFVQPAFSKITKYVTNQIDKQFLGANFHTFRVSR